MMRTMLNRCQSVAGLSLLTQSWRSLSTGTEINSGHLELRTGLFGRLSIVSSDRPVEIASLDPNLHEDIGRVLVSQVDLGDEAQSSRDAGCSAVAKQTGERQWLIESISRTSQEQTQKLLAPLRAMIPIPMDLSVTAGMGGCSVSAVENSRIDFTSTSPSTVEFSLDRVKSADVNLVADEGSTCLSLSRTLLQTLNVRARDSLALKCAAMYQGSELNLQCNNGLVNMDANAIYCRNCSLNAGCISLRCGSAHGNFHATSDGAQPSRLAVDSLEGSLSAKLLYGDVRLHLTRPGQIDIDLGEGCVDLSLQPPDSDANTDCGHSLLLDITAPDIDVEGSELAHLADSRFPLGPHAVRLVAELPCLGPLDKSDGEGGGGSSSCCSVRLRSGRVKLSQRSASGLFAWLRAS